MKRLIIVCLCGAMLLSGCGNTPSTSPEPIPQEFSASPDPAASRRAAISRPDLGEEVVFDPPYDFDPEVMFARDFGDYFIEEYATEQSSYLIAEGTNAQNEVLVLKGAEPGPTIYLVAGIHGDEIAGWMTGNLMKKVTIKAGALHILSPANRWGATAEPRTRYVTENQDLNRSFPGSGDGTFAQQVAASIYHDIEAVAPVFLLDLHEARSNRENSDFLGSSLIYTSLDNMSDMYLELLLATETEGFCSERFNFFAPGPVGSINNVVTTQLEIPTITLETYRGYPLERRIGDQLAITEFILQYYGLR